jgi:predicted transcriptional regulator
MLGELFLLALGFALGCVCTFLFARYNKKKFLRYMTTDIDLLVKNAQEEIKNVSDPEKAKAILAGLKTKVDVILKKNQ